MVLGDLGWVRSELDTCHTSPLPTPYPRAGLRASKNLGDTDIFRSIFDSNEREDPYVTDLKTTTVKPRTIKFGFYVLSNIAHALYLDWVNNYAG
jgi:hypothetical protein